MVRANDIQMISFSGRGGWVVWTDDIDIIIIFAAGGFFLGGGEILRYHRNKKSHKMSEIAAGTA